MTNNIHLPHPTHFMRPTMGALIAAGAMAILAIGAMTHDAHIGLDPSLGTQSTIEAQTISHVAYDPFDFTATVTAFDAIDDFSVVAEPFAFTPTATPYSEMIDGMAAGDMPTDGLMAAGMRP